MNKEWLVLSNTGSVEYHGMNSERASEIALELNAEYQNTSIKFFVVEKTPYRLICSRIDAEALSAFPYMIVNAYEAAWFMSKEEYRRQMMRPDELWCIIWAGGSMEADYFDAAWYEEQTNIN